MPENDDNFHSGHRERLKEKFLENKLAEYEQLELLLGFAIPRRDVRPLSRRLIEHFGSVYYVIVAEYDELLKVKGVGRSTAILIKLVCKMLEISHIKKLQQGTIFINHKSLEDFCRIQLAGKTSEEFHVIYLDANLRMIEHEIHSHGNIESSNVYIDKIMKKALNSNTRSILLMHNHPGTDNSFSTQDVLITQQIEFMLKQCNMELYDHYVLAGGVLFSMRERGLLNQSQFVSK